MVKKRISLGRLEHSRLSKNNMINLRGGDYVIVVQVGGIRCGCNYANQGGASTNANHDANVKADLWTVRPHEEVQTVCEPDATHVAKH
jgi:natural product precursor